MACVHVTGQDLPKIHIAARDGDLKELIALIESEIDVNTRVSSTVALLKIFLILPGVLITGFGADCWWSQCSSHGCI